MAKQSDLFDLIKALTKSEKRYFKLQTSLYSKNDSKYLVLFDLVDRQARYDEDAVRTSFEEQVPGTRFSDAARYLHQNILKTLHLFHLEKSVDSRIRMLLHQAEIMLHKKLYGQFDDIIKKVADLCERHERHLPALEMLNMQKQACFLGQGRDLPAKSSRILQEMECRQKQANDLIEYWKLYIHLFNLQLTIGMPRQRDDLARYEQVLQHEVMQRDPATLPMSARRYYHLIHIFHARLTYEYHREVLHTERLLELDTGHQEGADRTADYLSALFNLCRACTSARMEDKFFAYHRRLVDICDKDSRRQRYRWYLRTLWLEANHYLHTGEFGKAAEVLQQLDEANSQFRGKVSLGFDYEIAFMGFLANFGLERHAKSVEYLNRILEKRSTETVRRDIYCIARLALLLVHVELKQYDLLEYLHQSTYRFLHSRNYIHRPESIILGFVRRLIKDGNQREALLRLRDELATLEQDRLGRNALDEYFHCTAWVESKLQSRPFADLVREKFAAEVALAAGEAEAELQAAEP